MMFAASYLHLGAFWPALDGLFSTQGIMVMLLVAYGAAMWMFLTSAPKVHTVMVSDLFQENGNSCQPMLHIPAPQIAENLAKRAIPDLLPIETLTLTRMHGIVG